MKEYRRMSKIGRVFQNPAMGTCPSMTILENLALADNKGKRYGLGLGVQKKREEHYKEMLRPLNLGLEDKLHVKVGSLSGGQRQAMSLFMSTMTPIDFLILDEHTAALDPKTADINMRAHGPAGPGEKTHLHDGDAQSSLCHRIWNPYPHDAPGKNHPGQKRRRKESDESGRCAGSLQ